MKLSKRCEYAIKALIELAIAYDKGEEATLINEIAVRDNIPPRYLEQILLGLKNSGVLLSKRGVGGGYALGKSPEAISLGEIIMAVDGPLSLLHSPRKSAENEVSSTLHSVMRKVGDTIKGALDNISLRDMSEMTINMIQKKSSVLNYVI